MVLEQKQMGPDLKTVLVVDDDPLICAIGETFFSNKFDCAVEIASNGDKALEIMGRDETDISLILCDLNMPGVDGLQFLRHVKEIDCDIPIIIASGESNRVVSLTEKLAVSHGINIVCTLNKPMNLKLLESIVINLRPSNNDNSTVDLEISGIELAQAIREDQFVVNYQPKIDPISCTPTGVEALARWQHPTQGLITPGQFIPIAERLGSEFIEGIHQRITKQIFVDAKKWKKIQNSFKVSINLSVELLENLSLPNQLLAGVKNHGLSPSDFVFEITESKILENKTAPTEILLRLSMLGFELSIDDFGTGYSNIDALLNFPFNELKIDQSFIRNAVDDKEACAVVEASLTLANKLGLRTVAEGVETQAHLDFVASQNFDEAQGFLIAKPMPVEQLNSWLLDRTDSFSNLFGVCPEPLSA